MALQQQEYIPTVSVAQILCCECGILIEPNTANMCLNCIRNRVDITDGLPKQFSLYFCRSCERWLQPPNQWLPCALESKELLALCLRRVKGLNKVRLIDAGFIWTEPHSKRLKLKLTIQKQVFASTIMQQVFVVEIIIANQQCPDCCKIMAKNTWKAVVQVRQKVDHKRTFLYLEQLILKHHAHKDTVNIRAMRDGIDFFFQSRSHAMRFLDFLQTVIPVRYKTSEQLISEDIHSGSANYKFTFSAEIIPVCKEDLVCLPIRVARSFGGISPLLLCSRVGTFIHLIDPNTLQTIDMPATTYWREPFGSLCAYKDLTEYYVLDVDVDADHQAGRLCRANVVVAKASEFGRSSQSSCVRTHLGRILKPGDSVLGYDLQTSNFNDSNFDQWSMREEMPDVVLVKKIYVGRTKHRKRIWKLRELNMEVDELADVETDQHDGDRELFMQELEEDPEMRASINLYKDPRVREEAVVAMDTVEIDDDGDAPSRIDLAELLDDLCIKDEPADR